MEVNGLTYFLLAASVAIGVIGCGIAVISNRAHDRDEDKRNKP